MLNGCKQIKKMDDMLTSLMWKVDCYNHEQRYMTDHTILDYQQIATELEAELELCTSERERLLR